MWGSAAEFFWRGAARSTNGHRSGDVLTLRLNQVQKIKARKGGFCPAFAAIPGDGSVVTWAKTDYGRASSFIDVAELLHVQQIQAFGGECDAILEDGSVVM